MSLPPVDVFVRTLTVNGYVLDRGHSDYGYIVMEFHRYDEFGVRVDYAFVLFDTLSEISINVIKRQVRSDSAKLVLIGPQRFPSVVCLTWEQFMAKLGGPVLSSLVTKPGFATILDELGHNRLPEGFTGSPDTLFERSPDTLFEKLVGEALTFLFPYRAIPYGHERSFEPLPDGVAFIDERTPILYDCKAYGKGYSIEADDIRRFASYIQDFNNRYGGYVSPVHAFLVITGKILDSHASLRNKARELRSLSNVQLVMITASVLGQIVELLAKEPVARRSVNWRYLLSDCTFNVEAVQSELRRLDKDRVIRRAT